MIPGVLQNFLGTYTSRYSDYDGYWLFGMLVDRAESFDIDLLHPAESGSEPTAAACAGRLAALKFAEQRERAGIPESWIREARLGITRSSETTPEVVNGRRCQGHDVRFAVTAVSDHGKAYKRAMSIFVAPHDPRHECRSTRGG